MKISIVIAFNENFTTYMLATNIVLGVICRNFAQCSTYENNCIERATSAVVFVGH